MHPDLGCYEERYRLTRDARLGLVASLSVLAPLAIGFFLMQGAFLGSVVFFVLAVVSALPAVVGLAIRRIAFRADHAGVTLGDGWLLRRNRAVFIPWADVEQVIIYPRPDSRADSPARCIGIQRRPGAPDLREGDEPVPGCPLPRVVTAATRPGQRMAAGS
jgi:hypothetical protein